MNYSTTQQKECQRKNQLTEVLGNYKIKDKRALWSGIRFPEGYNYEDMDTLYRVFNICSKISVTEDILYTYRKRFGSITKTMSRKNMDDRKRACEHLEAFVRAHTPEVFNKRQLKKARELHLSGVISWYLHGLIDAEKVVAAGRETGAEGCGIRIKAAYFVICFCPWLLKVLYPVYRPIRMLVWKVLGR